jgi:hypothetical protein
VLVSKVLRRYSVLESKVLRKIQGVGEYDAEEYIGCC